MKLSASRGMKEMASPDSHAPLIRRVCSLLSALVILSTDSPFHCQALNSIYSAFAPERRAGGGGDDAGRWRRRIRQGAVRNRRVAAAASRTPESTKSIVAPVTSRAR